MKGLMRCPACGGTMIEENFGGARIDVCNAGSYGLWFDAGELRRLDSEKKGAGPHLMAALEHTASAVRREGDITTLMVVSYDTEPTFRPGTSSAIFEGPYASEMSLRGGVKLYDVSPDGQRFLMIRERGLAGETTDQVALVLVQNWFEELTRLVPTP